MPIRRIHTNYSSTGERHYTYRLVANQRTESEAHQIPLNLILDRRMHRIEVSSESASVEQDVINDQPPD